MSTQMTETYGRTPTGQLLYDLVFTDIAPSTIKRKHKLPATVEQIESLRKRCRKEAGLTSQRESGSRRRAL
jgi:hypothetical protein